MNWTDFMIAEKKGLVVNKERVDNIQTTSRATLSTAGWYRVAKYVGGSNSAKGAYANGCKIALKRTFYTNTSEAVDLILKSRYGKQEFVLESAFSDSTDRKSVV